MEEGANHDMGLSAEALGELEPMRTTSSASSSSDAEELPFHGYQELVDDPPPAEPLGMDLDAAVLEAMDARAASATTVAPDSFARFLPRAAAAAAPAAQPSAAPASDGLAGDDFAIDAELVKRIASTIRLKRQPPP